MSEDGEILTGVVIDLKIEKEESLPAKLGIGTHEKHDIYITRYPEGFELEWSWEPGECAGYQRAQKILLTDNPNFVYDPWNPKGFWSKKAAEYEVSDGKR